MSEATASEAYSFTPREELCAKDGCFRACPGAGGGARAEAAAATATPAIRDTGPLPDWERMGATPKFEIHTV